jgi:hypothetical protein
MKIILKSAVKYAYEIWTLAETNKNYVKFEGKENSEDVWTSNWEMETQNWGYYKNPLSGSKCWKGKFTVHTFPVKHNNSPNNSLTLYYVQASFIATESDVTTSFGP